MNVAIGLHTYKFICFEFLAIPCWNSSSNWRERILSLCNDNITNNHYFLFIFCLTSLKVTWVSRTNLWAMLLQWRRNEINIAGARQGSKGRSSKTEPGLRFFGKRQKALSHRLGSLGECCKLPQCGPG